MSKLTRALILGATLAAMNLVGLTAVAHAQASDPDGKDARRRVSTFLRQTRRGITVSSWCPPSAG
jgi:hypothetical protein